MNILQHLISLLDFDTPVRDIRLGLFHTGVLTRHCGLAASLPKDAMRQKSPLVAEPGSLLQKSPEQLARMAHSQSILEAAVGMAAINSLLQVDEQACIELNAGDLIQEKGAGKRVAIVGHFPFIPKLRETAKSLWVIEKNRKGDDLPEKDADHVLPQADVVGITGTALTNHTLEHLLGLCPRDSYVVMLGDTVPITPVLFEYGVDAVSGTRVSNPRLALQCISEGANFRQIKGTRRLTLLKP